MADIIRYPEAEPGLRILKGDVYFVFSLHAVARMAEREVPLEYVISAIQHGRFKKFGNNMVRITKDFKKGRLACVGFQFSENACKLLTIEWMP